MLLLELLQQRFPLLCLVEEGEDVVTVALPGRQVEVGGVDDTAHRQPLVIDRDLRGRRTPSDCVCVG